MSKASSKGAARNGDVLRLVAEALAPYLRELFQVGGTPFYDQTNSPLGHRKHLDLVRRGTLPAQKVGRRVRVSREAVERYIVERCRARPRAQEDASALADWGLTRRER